jgi:hypothetical protein
MGMFGAQRELLNNQFQRLDDAEKSLVDQQQKLGLQLRNPLEKAFGQPGQVVNNIDKQIADIRQQKINLLNRMGNLSGSQNNSIGEGSTATNPKTGKKLIYKGGKWQTYKAQ